MRIAGTDKALKKIRAAYLRAQVITAMDEQWDSILTLDEEPYEALYKFCDLELGIPLDSPGGGILAALNTEAVFVALTRDGVSVVSVPEFAVPRNMHRPEAPRFWEWWSFAAPSAFLARSSSGIVLACIEKRLCCVNSRGAQSCFSQRE